MMDAYLLDTNIASAWFDKHHKHHDDAKNFIERLGSEAVVYISRLLIAEMLYGHAIYINADKERRKILEDRLRGFKLVRDIGKHTVDPYACIRARLFDKYGERDKKGRVKKKRPEELIDESTAKELHIQENDLWMAAIAVEYDMVFVSHDRVKPIREVAPELRFLPWIPEQELRVDNASN